jgi:uncharacterized protein DUF541
MARLALVAAVLLLVLPASAVAQFGGPFNLPSEDYGPGITVSGVGFAPLGERGRATARAVGDARRRAEGIAAALGVSLGELRAVEANTPFEPRAPRCARSQSRRCAPLDAVSVETTFAISGGPSSEEGAREITGTGTGSSPVEVARMTSPAIRSSLRAARLAATPGAAEAARANAEAAAGAAGVPLGPLFSVVEPSNLYGYEPLLGAFGPGRFCGIVRRVIVRRDPETGDRRVVGRRRTRRCYKPSSATVRIEATYLGG